MRRIGGDLRGCPDGADHPGDQVPARTAAEPGHLGARTCTSSRASARTEDVGEVGQGRSPGVLVLRAPARGALVGDEAFGHAGQKCSAASLGILVGSVATSKRFRRQLVDAVRSLKVGYPADLQVTMGPIIEPPQGKLLRALTKLDPGESWLVTPKQLDESGRLWSPGLKTGVRPGSFFHLTEVFGPVLGLMQAKNLAEAIEWQNATSFGLTGGLHSLDADEIAQWAEDEFRSMNGQIEYLLTECVKWRKRSGKKDE